jgi:hypothetical protein
MERSYTVILTDPNGAIANALDTLVKLGEAELATEKPRRFRHDAILGPVCRQPRGLAGSWPSLVGTMDIWCRTEGGLDQVGGRDDVGAAEGRDPAAGMTEGASLAGLSTV